MPVFKERKFFMPERPCDSGMRLIKMLSKGDPYVGDGGRTNAGRRLVGPAAAASRVADGAGAAPAGAIAGARLPDPSLWRFRRGRAAGAVRVGGRVLLERPRHRGPPTPGPRQN